MNGQQELFNTKGAIPLFGVPFTIADHFCNVPPSKINGKQIYYRRANGEPTQNIIFYAENKNGDMYCFELIDVKSDCKINGKDMYKRFFITPVFPYAECAIEEQK